MPCGRMVSSLRPYIHRLFFARFQGQRLIPGTKDPMDRVPCVVHIVNDDRLGPNEIEIAIFATLVEPLQALKEVKGES